MSNKITNPEIIEEIRKSKENGAVTDKLAKVFMFIAKFYINNPSYKHLSYNEDMEAQAVLKMFESYSTFNPELSSNPFGYLATVTRCAYANYATKK